MAEDFYKTLGVSRDASQADIEKAYRELARKYHPDLNPDDKTAKQKFQTVQSAFDVLNDPQKREMYDRYGNSFENVSGSRAHPGAAGAGGANWEDIDLSQFFGERFGAEGGGGFGDIFEQLRRGGSAGRGRRSRRSAAPSRGADLTSELSIPFRTAVTGGETHIRLQRGTGKMETIAVKIPAGIDGGKQIRLRGQGEAAPGNGTPGDILITIHVEPHPNFHRQGNNLQLRVPVTLAEATLGGKVSIPTPKGTVELRIPPGTSSGTKLRVRGHGVTPSGQTPGDLFAEVQVIVPKNLDDESQEAIRKLDQRYPLRPRDDLHW